MSLIEKLAAHWGVSPNDALQRCAEMGMSQEGLEKCSAGAPLIIPTFEEGMRMALPKTVASTLGGLAVGGGVFGASALAQRAHARKAEIQKGQNFERMLEKNQDLLTHENPEMVVEMFDTLHKFAPDMAAHPHTAGSFVRSSLNYQQEGISPDVVQNLVRTQAAHEQTHGAMAGKSPLDRLAIFGTVPGVS
jgi:hypothetical protein